jgi:probable phosphoglycerate mutase
VSSPLRRARRTAEVIAAALGVAPGVDAAWAELSLGEWDGLGHAQIAAGWPAEYVAWRADPAATPPGGESIEDVARRVRAARDRLVAAHPGGTVLVVSHTAPIRAVVADALDAGPAAMWRLRIDPASMTVLRYWADGGCEVAAVNLSPTGAVG